MTSAEQKKRLRKDVAEAIRAMPREAREEESATVCRIITEHLPKKASICAYWADDEEANLAIIIQQYAKKDRTVALPCYSTQLLFRIYTEETTMVSGAFGILQPSSASLILAPGDIDIVLVPGRAFDVEGNRLGRGKGAYDTWIEAQRKTNPQTQFWGIALSCQMVSHIPTEEHDQKMDAVLHPNGFRSLTDNAPVLV